MYEFGKTENNDDCVYTGYKQNNKYHGPGRNILPEGDEYEGQFKDGIFHGKGQYIDGKTGITFRGLFKDGLKEGKGLELYENGNKFDGSWKLDKKDG